jgi:hypothetical protein
MAAILPWGDPNQRPTSKPQNPTNARPGTLDKIREMQRRYASGEELYHERDGDIPVREQEMNAGIKMKLLNGNTIEADKSIRILTVLQPYAYLLTQKHSEKPVENRPRNTNYRGWLIIHAGKSKDMLDTYAGSLPRNLPFGAIVGAIYLEDCVNLETVEPRTEYAWMLNHEHCSGRFCYLARNARYLKEPIPYKGQQGVKPIDPDVLQVVCDKLGIITKNSPEPKRSLARRQLMAQ